MQVKPYSQYRETSIEWAPVIPSEWDDMSVKFCFDIQLGKMLQPKQESIDDIEYPYLKALHVNWDNIDTETLPKMFVSENDIKKYSVVEGDLLVCEGGEVGRAAILNKLHEPAIIQNALHRVRNDELGDVGYFSYMLRNIADARWFDILCNKATIAHLTGEKLGAIRFPVPPIEEQQQIAAFLDYKTQQIDQLIAKKKALIEKLEEKRIAVITQAVTKGLDKNDTNSTGSNLNAEGGPQGEGKDSPSRLKPSGMDWLGDVPEHWECCSLKYFSNTFDCKHITAEFSDDGHPLVSITEVKDWHINLTTSKKTTFEYYIDLISGGRKPVSGDIIYSRNATVGEAALVLPNTPDFAMGQDVCLIRCNESLSPEFLMYVLNSRLIFKQLDLLMVGSTFKRINVEDIRNYVLTIPPLREQEDIVSYLNLATSKVNNMISKVIEAADRLKEYRSALITVAVTGKIDVREIEIPKEAS